MSIRTLVLFTAAIQTVHGIQISLQPYSSTLTPEPNGDSFNPNMDNLQSDAVLNFTQIATKYGYTAEEYNVNTEDGYVLKIFHLKGKGNGLPVLLFHGLLDSADTWILRGNNSLAITLVNAGYDVWLGNVRGNKYSQGHRFLSADSNSQTYWNFTFHEHAIYDLPATIDFVLRETGASKLNAIGHSQGTTIHFILLSSKPEYNDKVNLLIALAPVAYLHHSPLRLTPLFSSLQYIYEVLEIFHKYNIFGRNSSELKILRDVCSTPKKAYSVCLKGILYRLCGYDLQEVEPSFAVVVIRHLPTTTSTKNLAHFGQVATSKRFARFDYGKAGNLAAYQATKPPEYVLKNVKSKIVLLTAFNDFLSAQADVALLRRQLPNIVSFVVNPRTIMNHLDYIWGRHMDSYLFPYIFNSLKMYG